VSMWLLADGPVPFSDGVCAFLGNGPSLFFMPVAGLFLTRLSFEKIFKTQRVFKKAGQLYLQLLAQNIDLKQF